MSKKKISVPIIKQMKERGEKISVLTAYDYTFAKLMDKAGIDVLLVGDSLGMVVQGHEDTLPVTLDEMIYHTKAVKRGTKRAHIVTDLPFMSYQVNEEKALHNAGRILKESGADSVKLEGGTQSARVINRLVNAGIPVMGHVGLGPQSYKKLGGHKVQGKTLETAKNLISDAKAVEQAGAYSLVIEAVPWPIAKIITERLSIPTIGIGAGPHCDGQVLVFADMLGLFTAFQPHFVRRFDQLGERASHAFSDYVNAVKTDTFPTLDESYSIDQEIITELENTILEMMKD